MLTIPDTMRVIAKDIQYTFEELIKLLLRKSLRPILNPLGTNTKIVYNTFRGRYERGFVGSSPDDNINKYSYIMTHDSIGWSGEILTSFKAMAKFIKNNTPQRFPAGHTKIHNQIKSRAKVAFSDKEAKQHLMTGRMPGLTQYKNFLTFLTSRSMHKVIANKNASFTYTCDVPYTHSFKQLENIGKDIIDQTDPSISGCDSAKMSTSMLRVKLYNLEQNLANLSVDHPNIYDSYIEMLRIINSVPKTKIVWVINLIAALSYQRWDDLPPNQQKSYMETLGENFICAFNSNELITILLQSNTSEIILTSSYLYSLLKMLFIVFGYSKIVPIVSDNCSLEMQTLQKERLRRHLERYRGASFRRGDPHAMMISEPHYDDSNRYKNHDSNNDQIFTDTNNSTIGIYPSSECYEKLPRCATRGTKENSCPEIYFENRTPQMPEPEPIDQCIYDFIKLFGDLYPTIIGLMGGTEEFPPETIVIGCNDIPPNYDCLTSLLEYLWRFNDYSYCRYLEYVDSRQLHNALNSKINAKAKYLNSI